MWRATDRSATRKGQSHGLLVRTVSFSVTMLVNKWQRFAGIGEREGGRVRDIDSGRRRRRCSGFVVLHSLESKHCSKNARINESDSHGRTNDRHPLLSSPARPRHCWKIGWLADDDVTLGCIESEIIVTKATQYGRAAGSSKNRHSAYTERSQLTASQENEDWPGRDE